MLLLKSFCPTLACTTPFDDCVMFHLLTVFSSNAAKQERCYITNVLKKPQWVSTCQFVQHVEQLNSYITQLPCWCYSPSAKPSMIPMSIPFAEADLESHLDVPTPVAGSVQPAWEWYDSPGHAFASIVSWGHWVPMYPRKIQCTIQWEVFSQGQEKKQEAWCRVHGQGSQENSHWEELWPLQCNWQFPMFQICS